MPPLFKIIHLRIFEISQDPHPPQELPRPSESPDELSILPVRRGSSSEGNSRLMGGMRPSSVSSFGKALTVPMNNKVMRMNRMSVPLD